RGAWQGGEAARAAVFAGPTGVRRATAHVDARDRLGDALAIQRARIPGRRQARARGDDRNARVRRGGDRAGLHALARSSRTVRRQRHDGTSLQRTDDPEESDFAAALGRAAYRAITPALGEIHEIPTIAMPADEQHDPLVLANRQEWENARV